MAAGVVLAGCAAPEPAPAPVEEAPTSLTLGVVGSLTSLNAASATGNTPANRALSALLDERLGSLDGDLQVVPNDGLGRITRVQGDPLKVSYELFSDRVWSDGTPVTLDDLLFGWAVTSHYFDDATYDATGQIVSGTRYFNTAMPPTRMHGPPARASTAPTTPSPSPTSSRSPTGTVSGCSTGPSTSSHSEQASASRICSPRSSPLPRATRNSRVHRTRCCSPRLRPGTPGSTSRPAPPRPRQRRLGRTVDGDRDHRRHGSARAPRFVSGRPLPGARAADRPLLRRPCGPAVRGRGGSGRRGQRRRHRRGGEQDPDRGRIPGAGRSDHPDAAPAVRRGDGIRPPSGHDARDRPRLPRAGRPRRGAPRRAAPAVVPVVARGGLALRRPRLRQRRPGTGSDVDGARSALGDRAAVLRVAYDTTDDVSAQVFPRLVSMGARAGIAVRLATTPEEADATLAWVGEDESLYRSARDRIAEGIEGAQTNALFDELTVHTDPVDVLSRPRRSTARSSPPTRGAPARAHGRGRHRRGRRGSGLHLRARRGAPRVLDLVPAAALRSDPGCRHGTLRDLSPRASGRRRRRRGGRRGRRGRGEDPRPPRRGQG